MAELLGHQNLELLGFKNAYFSKFSRRLRRHDRIKLENDIINQILQYTATIFEISTFSKKITKMRKKIEI